MRYLKKIPFLFDKQIIYIYNNICYITNVIFRKGGRDDMPPARKVRREDIIKVTLDILKNESMESVNARRIAKELNCSVQPIFYNFENMEELKSVAFKEIYKIYIDYIRKGEREERSYKGMGLSYIKFAKDYPNYFKIIFMGRTEMTAENFISNDDIGIDIIKKGMEFTGFSYEEQKKFHVKVWIFTHGIATLVATRTVTLSDDEIDLLLTDTVKAMVRGIKKG